MLFGSLLTPVRPTAPGPLSRTATAPHAFELDQSLYPSLELVVADLAASGVRLEFGQRVVRVDGFGSRLAPTVAEGGHDLVADDGDRRRDEKLPDDHHHGRGLGPDE